METIKVQNLNKKFKIGKRRKTALEKLKTIFDKKEKDEITVLDNISFSVNKGETLGIIGRNGSGKSTLLMILSGIYNKDKGKIKIQGKTAFLSIMNNGLIPELTMKENIFLSGSILGLTKKQIKNKFKEIVNFSGIKEFLYTKVSKFSMGMILRLSFSITVFSLNQSKPDIILLDEVFHSGGDIDFQKKAKGKMEELIKSGATTIIASHDLELIKNQCQRTIWLEEGKIKMFDESKKVCDEYERSFN